MMSRLFVTMKLGRGNFFWASLEILNMSWMRQKYEVEAVAKGEELEMTKMKLAARNTEAEATV